LSSCSQYQNKQLQFSVSYLKDLGEVETIYSVKKKEMLVLENPKIGFENGVYWFKIILLEKTNSNSFVFNLPESNIDKITIYQDSKEVPYQELDNTHFSILVNSDSFNPTYFLRASFHKEVFFPLKVKAYNITQLNEKYSFFKNGIYYGFALMVFIVNIFFFISLKDKTFLFYCFFLIAVNLVFLDFDGLLNTILPNSFEKYDSLVIHYLVPLTGLFFANQFLNIKYYLPKSNKIGVFLLLLATGSFLLFIPTNQFLFIALGDTFSLLVLLHYWGISILISKKYKFARFFVLGYSLVLFSAFLFVIPLDWGLNMYAASLSTVKVGAIFEMLILTYAITYKVKLLHKENKKIKLEIQEYLYKILPSENDTDASIEKSIEFLVTEKNISKREVDVLLLIFKEYTNQKIADELFVSLNTVKYHIRNIYEKLNINSKNEAIDILAKIENS